MQNSTYIDPVYQSEFQLEMSRLNLQRGKLFAAIIIGIELILLIILLLDGTQHTSFKYNWYAFMYILMISVTAVILTAFSFLYKKINSDQSVLKKLHFLTTSYATFLMIWGAVISLNDQALYGCIVVFLMNVLIASMMFYIRPVYEFISLSIATAFFYIGLPYYQPSWEVLIGHYVNTSIFIVFTWFLARANYLNFVRSFMNQKLIEEKSDLLAYSNNELVKEIQSREQTQKELEVVNEQLMIISTLDALTGIPNRRRLDEVLQEQWKKAVAEQLPISIMMIDIDFFKLYNDTNGHLAGDRCLQMVAEVMNECRRGPDDFVARFGGEEFLFVAMGISKKETMLLGERIRLEIAALGIQHPNSPVEQWITVSLGISHILPSENDKLIKVLEQSDRALYRAKSAGRNQLALAE